MPAGRRKPFWIVIFILVASLLLFTWLTARLPDATINLLAPFSLGMTISEVESQLGNPLTVEPWNEGARRLYRKDTPLTRLTLRPLALNNYSYTIDMKFDKEGKLTAMKLLNTTWRPQWTFYW